MPAGRANQVWSEQWRWQWYVAIKAVFNEVDEYDNSRIWKEMKIWSEKVT